MTKRPPSQGDLGISATPVYPRRRTQPYRLYAGRVVWQWVENILAGYQGNSQRDQDRQWYWRARTQCENLAQECQLPLSQVVALVACLSPGCPWEKNIGDAQKLIQWQRENGVKSLLVASILKLPRLSTYRSNIRKALRILLSAGSDPLPILAPERGRALKTRAFYLAIMRPWQCEHVVIDRHAISVALGRAAKVQERRLGIRKYRDFQASYQWASVKLKVPPSEIQAACWAHWRRRAAQGAGTTGN